MAEPRYSGFSRVISRGLIGSSDSIGSPSPLYHPGITAVYAGSALPAAVRSQLVGEGLPDSMTLFIPRCVGFRLQNVDSLLLDRLRTLPRRYEVVPSARCVNEGFACRVQVSCQAPEMLDARWIRRTLPQ
jgi:hypothetical protein